MTMASLVREMPPRPRLGVPSTRPPRRGQGSARGPRQAPARPASARPSPSLKRPTELIDGVDALAELAPEWDALAVAASKPVAAPAWTLAWLRHVAPRPLEPRVLAVRDRGELVGVVPLYVSRARGGLVEYRLMA